jgi:hypothetical protein
MAEKQGKGFTLIKNKLKMKITERFLTMNSCGLMGVLLMLFLAFTGTSCNQQQDENLIPNRPVNIRVNMELPLYVNLQFPGNHVYLNGGNSGVVLIHGFDGEFYALDRMCSYEPFNECSRIEIDESLSMKCGNFEQGVFYECCASKFQFDGTPVEGPAVYPLRRYRVFRTGNILDISN